MSITPYFFIRSDGKFTRVDIRDIRYIEALKNYVKIVTGNRQFLVLISLRQIEAELPAGQFCRVSRSFIVSLAHIQHFDHELVQLEGASVPLSTVYKNLLQSKIKVLVSESRSRTSPGDPTKDN